MEKKHPSNIFRATNSLKVLSFLCQHSGKEFTTGEIHKATSLSRMGVYVALQDLVLQNMVNKTERGKFVIYLLNYSNPLVKQFKIINTILVLEGIIEKLTKVSRKIVLFGSASRGEDYSDSDIDLFVLARDPEAARSIASVAKLDKKLQTVIKTPVEYAEFNEKEKLFKAEIERGITLWEERE